MKRCRGDAGVLVVEAAFAFPVFLLLLFGIVDLGYAEFQTSQATAAARDGARAGILAYDDADVAGSSNNTLIQNQVRERLAGQPVQSINVSCLEGLSGSSALSCDQALPDQDRIRVTVTWTYNALTPVMAQFGPANISGTATMVILGSPTGLPTTTTTTSTTTTTTTTTVPGQTTTTSTSTTTTTAPPGTCSVTSLSVNPTLPLARQNKNSTSLKNDTTFTISTTGSNCTGLKIQLPTKGSATTVSLTFAGGSSWTVTVHKSDYPWAAGTNLPVLVQSSNGTTLTNGSFSISVT